jgi:hypothetical protein
MKRSQAVELRILPAVAAAALAMGCGSPANQTRQQTADRYCMDQSKSLVELTKCEEETSRRRPGHPYIPLYAWVYGPHGWRPGMHIGGNPHFSRVPPGSLTAPHPASNTVRGGFGSSARPVAS